MDSGAGVLALKCFIAQFLLEEENRGHEVNSDPKRPPSFPLALVIQVIVKCD